MELEYKIKFERRKTVSISINKDAEVIVKSPKYVSKKYIENFIVSKKEWIEKNLNKVMVNKNKLRKDFKNGEKFLYLGSQIELFVSDKDFKFVKFDGNNFIISKNNINNAKELFYKFYRKKAKEIILQRIKYYTEKYNFKINNIKISSASTRWGSCSHNNNININWKLIMADLKIMDYVIVHELSHTIEHNHSKDFWKIVENIIPDYKERRLWLKRNGGELDII